MIITYTLLVFIYAGTGITTHSSVFISMDDCVEAGKLVELKTPVQANFVCYKSRRIDVK
jgi:hypothetical protein